MLPRTISKEVPPPWKPTKPTNCRNTPNTARTKPTMRPVAFTMSVLAVLVAVTTVLGHRTHTEAVLDQNRATDQWNEYQAKKIRSYNTSLSGDLLSVLVAGR